MTLAGSGASVSAIVGGVTTKSGGKLVLGNNDFPTFSATRSRTLVVPLVPSLNGSTNQYGGDTDIDPTFGCLRSVITNDQASGHKIVFPIPKRYLHNGATLSTVTLAWRVGVPSNALPMVNPSMAVWRATTGGTTVALNSSAQLAVSPANADAYYFKGNVQTLAYTCNQNNVIDTTQYQYLFVWTEEFGRALTAHGPTLNLFHSLTLAYTAIADQRFE